MRAALLAIALGAPACAKMPTYTNCCAMILDQKKKVLGGECVVKNGNRSCLRACLNVCADLSLLRI